MELFNSKNEKMEKVENQNDKDKNLSIANDNLSQVSGGFSVEGAHSYKLTSEERDALRNAGYQMKTIFIPGFTFGGCLSQPGYTIYTIKDANGKMADPSEIEEFCKTIKPSEIFKHKK